jgi:ABC-type Fe3+-siderophore transport system permease subunit
MHKTIATYLTLFFGMLGMHHFYINRNLKIAVLYAFLHLSASLVFCYSLLYFISGNTQAKSIWAWIGISIGVINWCVVWLSSIYYGLMPAQKWVKFVGASINNVNDANDNYAKTNGLTVICVVCALMSGMGILMAFLSFAIQSYYES